MSGQRSRNASRRSKEIALKVAEERRERLEAEDRNIETLRWQIATLKGARK